MDRVCVVLRLDSKEVALSISVLVKPSPDLVRAGGLRCFMGRLREVASADALQALTSFLTLPLVLLPGIIAKPSPDFVRPGGFRRNAAMLD